jgi:hypothetical protein
MTVEQQISWMQLIDGTVHGASDAAHGTRKCPMCGQAAVHHAYREGDGEGGGGHHLYLWCVVCGNGVIGNGLPAIPAGEDFVPASAIPRMHLLAVFDSR